MAAVEAIERYEYFGAYATVIAECLHPTKDFAQVPFQPCVREVNELVDSLVKSLKQHLVLVHPICRTLNIPRLHFTIASKRTSATSLHPNWSTAAITPLRLYTVWIDSI